MIPGILAGRQNTFLLPTTALYVDMQGSNESTTFTDIKKHSVTPNGNAHISTAKSPFAGGSSLSLDGSGDYLSIAHSPMIALAGRLWTIQAWVYLLAYSSDKSVVLQKDGVAGSSNESFFMGITSAGKFRGAIGTGNGNTSAQAFTGTTTVAINTWKHLELGFDGSKVYGFVGGNQEWATTKTASMVDGGKPLLIGYETGQPAAQYFNGCIAHVMLTVNKCLHTSGFSAPTAPPVIY